LYNNENMKKYILWLLILILNISLINFTFADNTEDTWSWKTIINPITEEDILSISIPILEKYKTFKKYKNKQSEVDLLNIFDKIKKWLEATYSWNIISWTINDIIINNNKVTIKYKPKNIDKANEMIAIFSKNIYLKYKTDEEILNLKRMILFVKYTWNELDYKILFWHFE